MIWTQTSSATSVHSHEQLPSSVTSVIAQYAVFTPSDASQTSLILKPISAISASQKPRQTLSGRFLKVTDDASATFPLVIN